MDRASPTISETDRHRERKLAPINLGNSILANSDPVTNEPFGVSIDLARAFADRLSVDIELVVFDAAGKSVEAISDKPADIGFFAVDPLRAASIAFTAPYVLIEGFYLVREGSTIRSNADVDLESNRVAVGKGSAYDLFFRVSLSERTSFAPQHHPPVSKRSWRKAWKW